VFAGTVRSVSALPDDGPPLRPGEARIPHAVRVEFAEVGTFFGIEASTVSVVTAGGGAACGYGFKQGERYLVYATRVADGTGSKQASVLERGCWPMPTMMSVFCKRFRRRAVRVHVCMARLLIEKARRGRWPTVAPVRRQMVH
jgi:hypothetical protein